MPFGRILHVRILSEQIASMQSVEIVHSTTNRTWQMVEQCDKIDYQQKCLPHNGILVVEKNVYVHFVETGSL